MEKHVVIIKYDSFCKYIKETKNVIEDLERKNKKLQQEKENLILFFKQSELEKQLAFEKHIHDSYEEKLCNLTKDLIDGIFESSSRKYQKK